MEPTLKNITQSQVISPPPPPYTLNKAVAAMLGKELAEEYQRLLHVWRDKGWTCRDDIADLFDADADYAAIEDVGPVRAPLMRELMALPYDEPYEPNLFTAVCGLPVHDGEV